MNIIKRLLGFHKGGEHAERTGENVSGGREREFRIIPSIPAVCKQAESDFCGIAMLARACAAERSRDPGSLPADAIRRESRALISAAKLVGCYLDCESIPGTRYTIRSGESEVRMAQTERRYYKIKNPFAKLHLKHHPVSFVLFEHLVHNILFPECRLQFLGVTEDFGEARLVFRQEAVRTDARPDDKRIAHELKARGLNPGPRYEFGNENVFVTDVGENGDNVLLDTDGQVRFIDPIIGFREPLQTELSDAAELGEKIDRIVYKIYDLTNDEIKLMENETKS